MIRIIINTFFKLIKNSDSSTEHLSKTIENEMLIKEMQMKNELKKLWLKGLSYKLLNEKYKVTSIKLTKHSKEILANVTIYHSFIMSNLPSKLKSVEKLNYILKLRKSKGSWKITDCCCKEEFPNEFETIINECSDFSSKLSPFSISFKSDKNTFWKHKIDNIDSMLIKAKSSFIEYKSNYDDDFRDIDRNPVTNFNHFNAVSYARKYALNYNENYNSFNENGGDCTNYVSQCLKEGGLSHTTLWKPYSNSWIRVNELYNFIVKKGYGKEIKFKDSFKVGSIIQFYSNEKGFYSHSGIITQVLGNGDCLYCCHSYDKLDYPLSQIYPFFYDKYRIIEIN